MSKAPRPITGRKVLIGFLAFFGVIFAVNGVFVYFALDSWPGLRFEKSYERGLNYNRVLSEAETQAALEWSSRVSAFPNGSGGYLLSVRLSGTNGEAVVAQSVEIQLSRPTHDRNDATLELKRAVTGAYEAAHRFPSPGRWHAEVRAAGSDGETYKMIHDIIIEP